MNKERVQCIFQYQRSFDDIEQGFIVGLMVLRVFNLFYCFLCYKWRHLSSYIIYLECLLRMVAATMPRAINENKANFVTGQELGLTFALFYCDNRGHFIATVVAMVYNVYVPPILVYM